LTNGRRGQSPLSGRLSRLFSRPADEDPRVECCTAGERTGLYYTIGKLEIYKLRADYQNYNGNSYSLQKFHDAFLSQGGIPIKLMRELLMPGDSQRAL